MTIAVTTDHHEFADSPRACAAPLPDLAPFDAMAALARRTLRGTFAVLSAFDQPRARQAILGIDGAPSDLAVVREIPLIGSYCSYVYEQGCQLVVDDVSQEHQIAKHPIAHRLGVQAYAGWHVTATDGRVLGVLCVMEDHPRAWEDREVLDLMELAHRCRPLLQDLAW